MHMHMHIHIHIHIHIEFRLHVYIVRSCHPNFPPRLSFAGEARVPRGRGQGLGAKLIFKERRQRW